MPLDHGTYNIPTDSIPSPFVCRTGQVDNTLCAEPFTQQMLLFEEFGLESLPLDPGAPLAPGVCLDNAGTLRPCSFPTPDGGSFTSGPPPDDLEAFLAVPGIGPYPTRQANTDNALLSFPTNPWETVIENFLGRGLAAPPAEGRPPGEAFAHQRWNEFYPQEFFKTAMAGARVNHGFRDAKQRHGYTVGNSAPDPTPYPARTTTGSITGSTGPMITLAYLKDPRPASRSGSTRSCPSRIRSPSGPSTGRSRPSCSWRATGSRC